MEYNIVYSGELYNIVYSGELYLNSCFNSFVTILYSHFHLYLENNLILFVLTLVNFDCSNFKLKVIFLFPASPIMTSAFLKAMH